MLWLAVACLGILGEPERQFLLDIHPWMPVGEPHVWWSSEHSRFNIAVIARDSENRAACTAFQPYRTNGFIHASCSPLFR